MSHCDRQRVVVDEADPFRMKSQGLENNWPAARILLFWLLASIGFPVCAAYGQLVPATSFELTETELHEISSTQAGALASIRELLNEEQWDEALDRLTRFTETSSDQLIALDGNRYVTLREYCHHQISRLPPEALELYRLRVDPLAEAWFSQGVAERDISRLRRVVDTMFCSRWGDDALLAIGELALQQGNYGMARSSWERISRQLRGPEGRPLWLALRDIDLETNWDRVEPILTHRDSTGADHWLAYPDTDLSLADIRARLILVSIREGSFDRAGLELALFSKLHPDAAGRLGGRQVVFAKALSDLLTAAKDWPAWSGEPDWPTFAGSPERAGTAPSAVPIAGPAWDAPLTQLAEPQHRDPGQRLGFSGRRIGEDAERPLSYHPIILGDSFFYCDAHRVYARKLATGEGAYTPDGVIYAPQRDPQSPIPSGRQILGVPRYTMTAHAGRLYACMGDPIADLGTSHPSREQRLVGLDLKRGGMLLFEVAPEDASWAFEGAPVADDRSIYVAMRQSDVSPRASVACFDGYTGKMRWRTFVASGSSPGQPGWDEITHNLLTLVEDTIYYNTNLGVVAALSADDGNIRWIARYDRAKRGDLSRRAAHFYRDLTPCVYDAGLLFVAPSDSPYLFALDAMTGQVMWATDLADDVVHLLGVADGNLIASGDRLWWLNAQTGKVAAPPWPENRRAGIRGYGRGFLAGNQVYWPTQQAEILVFRTVPKTRHDETVHPMDRIDLAAYGAESGNILVVHEFLMVATPDRIYAFSQFPRERDRLQHEAATRPDDPAAQFRFAQCERAMGHWENATEYYRRAIQLSPNSQTVRTQASHELTAMLLERAEVLRENGQLDAAIEKANDAIRLAVTPRDRVNALMSAARIEVSAERPVEAIARWQQILDDDHLAGYPVEVDEYRKLAARLVVQDQIAKVIRDYGHGVYARQEAAAMEALATAQRNQKNELLSVARRFPNAQATRGILATSHPRPGIDNRITHKISRVENPPFRISGSFPVSGRTRLADDGEEVIITNKTLLTADRNMVRGISVADGSIRWQRLFEEPIVDAANYGQYAFLATAHTISRLEIDRGHVSWSAGLRRNDRSNEITAVIRLGLGAHGRIDVLLDNGTLNRYNSETGQLLWKHHDPSWCVARLPYEQGNYLLLQRTPRSWNPDDDRPYQTVAIDPKTGQALRTLPDSSAAWARRPLRLDSSHVVLVDTAGNIQMVDLAWNELVWSRSAMRLPASQAEVVFAGDALLLFDGIGDMLRLDPTDGRALWQKTVSVGPQILARPRQVVTWDGNAVYLVSAGKLKAFWLADGHPRWPVSDVRIAPEERRWRWQVHRFGSYIVAHPLEFAEPDGFRFVVAQESNGHRIAQSDPIMAPPGEARVIWWPDNAILVGNQRVWKIEQNSRSDR
ncbi:MAG: PQQ-binding-like beta-propeller repeat protein [Pirellulales bacterium]|nr:PQQ-binding-like beta-propeller repeat protein [Pirellulales bacterium]